MDLFVLNQVVQHPTQDRVFAGIQYVRLPRDYIVMPLKIIVLLVHHAQLLMVHQLMQNHVDAEMLDVQEAV